MIGQPAVRTFLIMAVLVLATGCDSASRKASARLRRDVVNLQQQVDALQKQEKELQAQLKQAQEGRDELEAEILASTPFVSSIALSPFSGMRRDEGDGPVMELFVSAVDGRGRPLQVVGRLQALAMLIPSEGETVELGRVDLGPAEVRDAWRGGLGGASYLVEVPMTGSLPEGTSTVHVRVFHEDARTGEVFEASGDIRPKPVSEGLE